MAANLKPTSLPTSKRSEDCIVYTHTHLMTHYPCCTHLHEEKTISGNIPNSKSSMLYDSFGLPLATLPWIFRNRLGNLAWHLPWNLCWTFSANLLLNLFAEPSPEHVGNPPHSFCSWGAKQTATRPSSASGTACLTCKEKDDATAWEGHSNVPQPTHEATGKWSNEPRCSTTFMIIHLSWSQTNLLPEDKIPRSLKACTTDRWHVLRERHPRGHLSALACLACHVYKSCNDAFQEALVPTMRKVERLHQKQIQAKRSTNLQWKTNSGSDLGDFGNLNSRLQLASSTHLWVTVMQKNSMNLVHLAYIHLL